jgi:hypothetical protein
VCSELVDCLIVTAGSGNSNERSQYIELVRRIPDVHAPCRPQVICEVDSVAKRVVQQVNYAKVLYQEMRHSQIGNNTNSIEE